MANKIFKGIVTSNKMAKTITVEIESIKRDAKYRRSYKSHTKLHAHCEDSSKYEVGQRVAIKQCRPLSKTKKFIVVEG
jgi:small subunit ribosomal protein S17